MSHPYRDQEQKSRSEKLGKVAGDTPNRGEHPSVKAARLAGSNTTKHPNPETDLREGMLLPSDPVAAVEALNTPRKIGE